jgi:hypothetical protein
MAGVMGLEPTTFAVTGRRCNQLNYTPADVELKDSKELFQLGPDVNWYHGVTELVQHFYYCGGCADRKSHHCT